MKTSIKRQIAFIFIGLVVSMMLLAVLGNSQFLERYYVYNKQSTLISVYKTMEAALAKGMNSYEDLAEELSEAVEVGNIAMVIVSSENQSILTSTSNDRETQIMVSQLFGYLVNKNQEQGQLLAESETYQIHSAKDKVAGTEYIEMWGYLSDQSLFIIRSPLESIHESVMLSNRFFLYMMTVLVVVGSVCVWLFAKQIATPILELADLSKRMANLEFHEKYHSKGKNEIDILGENFNAMSNKLEDTISKLKNANYELQKDIEKKEKMENMRTEFIGNISHELKTPLALIQGYAEGLKEGISEDPESRAFYCDVIMDEANKMNHMVKNLLTLNQLEVGEECVEFTRFDLMELIRGVVESNSILIQQKDAKVEIAPSHPVFVWSDEWKTEQVLRNYFGNALNHVDGRKQIEIRVEDQKETGNVRIFVKNTGMQIPEEDIDQIWNKFYKVDKAHTREYGGNGIGLSIVKAIMDSFHREYGVQNQEDGVEFWFELDAG